MEKEDIVSVENASVEEGNKSKETKIEKTHSPLACGNRNVRLERQVLRKIDIRLLPMLGLLYTAALVDRANISVARISGLDGDVGLNQGNRASIALLVFFIGYIIFEIPSNIVIRHVGAANWISVIVFAWGIVSLGIGFLSDWVGLAICRAILGVFEAGFMPGCVYLISSWYKRYEVQKRLAIFYLTSTLLTAFANIFAYGLIQIADHTSYKGWRWIYIIEGALTSLLAIMGWFVIIDFPASNRNRFLSLEEKHFVLARLTEDRGKEDREKISMREILYAILDWKVWSFSFMYMSAATGAYAFLFFLPIILQKGLLYSQKLAFVLSAPPSIFAVIEAFAISWMADKIKLRGVFVLFQACLTIVGLCMTAWIKHPTPKYIGTFLGMAGATGMIPTVLAWQQNNIVGDARRAIATAILVMASAVGGIYSSLVFRQQDAPNYLPGIIAVMMPNIVTAILVVATIWALQRKNRQMDEVEHSISDREGFRYTY